MIPSDKVKELSLCSGDFQAYRPLVIHWIRMNRITVLKYDLWISSTGSSKRFLTY